METWRNKKRKRMAMQLYESAPSHSFLFFFGNHNSWKLNLPFFRLLHFRCTGEGMLKVKKNLRETRIFFFLSRFLVLAARLFLAQRSAWLCIYIHVDGHIGREGFCLSISAIGHIYQCKNFVKSTQQPCNVTLFRFLEFLIKISSNGATWRRWSLLIGGRYEIKGEEIGEMKRRLGSCVG